MSESELEEDFGEMNDEEAVELLLGLLSGEALDDLGVDVEDLSVRSFRDAGVLTRDEGLVLRVGEAEFQVTVVRSR